MAYTQEEKYRMIAQAVKKIPSGSPVEIVKSVMREDFINIHGPEHHFLDAAAFIAAYKNAGGSVDLDDAFAELSARAAKMPGAMCGQWGVCGSVTAVGAALSVLHRTGPLSSDEFYAQHMEFTSSAIAQMSKIGGPRCCKRNAFLSLSLGAKFVREKYGVEMQSNEPKCEFTDLNPQCIKSRCPFYKR